MMPKVDPSDPQAWLRHASSNLTNNIDFPKTHSLVRLIDILEENGVPVPVNIKAADILSESVRKLD